MVEPLYSEQEEARQDLVGQNGNTGVEAQWNGKRG